MRSFCILMVCWLGVSALGLPAWGQASGDATSSSEIQSLIELLKDGDSESREAARTRLVRVGEEAWPELAAATTTDDRLLAVEATVVMTRIAEPRLLSLFTTAAVDSPATRALLAAMKRAEPEVMQALSLSLVAWPGQAEATCDLGRWIEQRREALGDEWDRGSNEQPTRAIAEFLPEAELRLLALLTASALADIIPSEDTARLLFNLQRQLYRVKGQRGWALSGDEDRQVSIRSLLTTGWSNRPTEYQREYGLETLMRFGWSEEAAAEARRIANDLNAKGKASRDGELTSKLVFLVAHALQLWGDDSDVPLLRNMLPATQSTTAPAAVDGKPGSATIQAGTMAALGLERLGKVDRKDTGLIETTDTVFCPMSGAQVLLLRNNERWQNFITQQKAKAPATQPAQP